MTVQMAVAGLDAGPAAGYRANRHRIPVPPRPLLPIHPDVPEPWQIHLDLSTPWPIRLGPSWADPPGPSSAPAPTRTYYRPSRSTWTCPRGSRTRPRLGCRGMFLALQNLALHNFMKFSDAE